MNKQALWVILSAMLGVGGGALVRPVFDADQSEFKPQLRAQRVSLFQMECPVGTPDPDGLGLAPCYGLEICAAVYANATADEPMAQGCRSGELPPDDAGGVAKLEAKGRQALRRGRADDAGVLGPAGTVQRVTLFACEGCSTVDGGTPYGVEATDEFGSVSRPLEDLPPLVEKLARDFWVLKTAKDAGSP